jgi:hypothetical protein
MKKCFDWLTKVLPTIWGVLWMGIITVGSVACAIAVVKWLLHLMGVL